MTVIAKLIRCKKCGRIVKDVWDTDIEFIAQCPQCGILSSKNWEG